MDNKELGQLGEKLACQYLKKQGYKILEQNYVKEWDSKTKGEIDIIAKKSGVVCFVEVKTSLRYFGPQGELSGNSNYFPEDRVNDRKQHQLVKLAQKWLQERGVNQDSPWQIDVVGIVVNQANPQDFKLEHYENAASAFT